MDQVFAPWRIDWIRREDHPDAVDGCPFCVLPDRDADRESRIVARSPHSFVICNNAPYNPGHVMVIPDAHEGDYTTLSPAEVTDHARLKQATFAAIRTALEPNGLNAGLNHGGDAAGGSIDDHLHTHVVPRYTGDTNFMPVISDTKVIVEAIDETYDHLREAFADLPCGTRPADEDAAVEVRFD
ncbi:HIT domain-containing protein [Halobaculum sp. MBLA0147]|uniref:HIT family protein n=1 Tax=Halobaculum sp. MBLA0147 TaxID=3079934 RepID=UPI00352358D4